MYVLICRSLPVCELTVIQLLYSSLCTHTHVLSLTHTHARTHARTRTHTHTHTDGALQYQVDVEDAQLPYNGPSILEVKGDEIVVWTSSTHEQVVRWKLAHIRSFKAKRSTLVIYPGRWVFRCRLCLVFCCCCLLIFCCFLSCNRNYMVVQGKRDSNTVIVNHQTTTTAIITITKKENILISR